MLIFSIILMQTKVVMMMVMVMSPKQVDASVKVCVSINVPSIYMIIPFADRGGKTLIRARTRESMCPNIPFTFVIILYAGETVKGDTKTGGLMSRGRCFYPFIDDVMVTSRSGVC